MRGQVLNDRGQNVENGGANTMSNYSDKNKIQMWDQKVNNMIKSKKYIRK